jgi:hypothetical protein
MSLAQYWWLTSTVILATQQAEIRRLEVRNPSQKQLAEWSF